MTNFKSHLLSAFILLLFLFSCSNNTSTENSSRKTDDNSSKIDKSDSNVTTPTNKTPERTSSSVAEKDPYEMMQVAFEGSPEISRIKPVLEAVIQKYDLPKTNEYRLKVGSMLVSLRKASAVGVTEMEILKHIYQHGSNQISLPDQAGISARLLETSK